MLSFWYPMSISENTMTDIRTENVPFRKCSLPSRVFVRSSAENTTHQQRDTIYSIPFSGCPYYALLQHRLHLKIKSVRGVRT